MRSPAGSNASGATQLSASGSSVSLSIFHFRSPGACTVVHAAPLPLPSSILSMPSVSFAPLPQAGVMRAASRPLGPATRWLEPPRTATSLPSCQVAPRSCDDEWCTPPSLLQITCAELSLETTTHGRSSSGCDDSVVQVHVAPSSWLAAIAMPLPWLVLCL